MDDREFAEVSVSIDVAADPDTVWALVADPENYVRWSPQVTGVRRLRGSGEWQAGDSWIGSNRLRLPWATLCVVDACEPRRTFAFTVDFGPLSVSRWTFDLEPDGTGTRVTETWQDRRHGLSRVVRLAGPAVGRGWDAAQHNLDSMRQTLTALKEEAESAARGASGSSATC